MTHSVRPSICYQINLQRGFGGGEVYTAFFTRALDALGVKTVLFAHPEAQHWRRHLPASAQVIGVSSTSHLAAQLEQLDAPWTVFHTPAPANVVEAIHRAGGIASCFAHMPVYDRDPAVLEPYDLILPVSRHVADSLRARGLHKVHDEPLYGVADLSGRHGNPGQPLVKGDVYAWDQRKARDRLFGLVYPWINRLQPQKTFAPLPGITLGIVSRITPIKQFPLLFTFLSPVLANFPNVHLEIFGSGGYASVRDLRRALAPIRNRVRFWGHQHDVTAAYAHLDYLLTGLPEKEALGLNVIEAQACGIPVLAVAAPPFTETIVENVTGLLYPDPRQDRGMGFSDLLSRLSIKPFKIDTERAMSHLQQFSQEAFVSRVSRLLDRVSETVVAQPQQTS